MSGPILIWGAGAIGGTIGAALVRAGEDVLFVERAADHVAAMNLGGLRITGPVEDYRTPVKAVVPEELRGVFGRTLLCVKAHDTADAARTLKPHLAGDGYVASVQNGLNERVIAGIVGADRTIGCFVNFGADYLEPGIVHFGGRGAVVVGELEGSRTARVDELFELLRLFEPGTVLTDNIWGYLWSKMIYGAQLFATAITNEGIADLLAEQRYRPLLTRLANEVASVGLAEAVRLEAFNGFDPAAFLPGASREAIERSFDEMAAHNRRSAKTHSGIWRDLAVRKRRTEVDAQLGPVATIGREHGLDTPITARLIAMIHEIEEGRRSLATANLDELDRLTAGAAAAGRGHAA
jgi:2-dehydropantoate 2-reductase